MKPDEEEALAAFLRDAGKMLEWARYQMTIAQLGNAICALMIGATWALAGERSAAFFGVFYLSATSVPYFVSWAWRRWR